MKTRRKLDRELAIQSEETADSKPVSLYLAIASGYAELERALVVLSDLQERVSYVVHGALSHRLDIDMSRCSSKIPSIWEDDIFQAVHPEDLEMKMTQELLFFHHILRQPPSIRFNHCLIQKLRMRTREGSYMDVVHRLFYIPSANGRTIRFAMCVYGAMTVAPAVRSLVADTLTGRTHILETPQDARILTRQEISVLSMIDSGLKSLDIAGKLNISVHTVSRHRQNIIRKLKVRNSTEACRTARRLKLLQ